MKYIAQFLDPFLDQCFRRLFRWTARNRAAPDRDCGRCIRDKYRCNQQSAPAKRTYSPASASISRRDFRARSVADFSCPQAAMMSSPRGVRIGLAYPAL